MEFRYRAGEQRGRPSSSSMNHYYSSSAPIAYFNTQRRFEGNFLNENLLEKIREERIIEERLATEMTRKRLIVEEMLAREIARRRMLEEEMFVKEIVQRRMLEEEIMRKTEHLNHFPVNNIVEGDYGFDQRLEHGLRKSPFNSGSIRYVDANAVIGGSDELRRVEIGNLTPTICSSRGTPRVSFDMKFPAPKLTGQKRKLTGQKRKLSRTCSLCGVTATSKKAMKRHVKGKRHRTKNARLTKTRPTSSFNSNVDFSVEENLSNDEACKKVMKHQHSNKTGWWCKLCQVKCSGEADMQLHLAGKKHKARFEANKEGGEEVEEEDEV